MIFNEKNFNKTIKDVDDLELTSFQLKPQLRKTGIKNIVVNDNNVIAEISSKLYPDLYKDMINKNTVEKYFEVFNKTKLIQFDVNEVINSADVLSLDCTNNIIVTGDVRSYVDSFSTYKLNNKYKCNYHINESIIFERDVKTNSLKERLTIYNKMPELLLKRNNAFRNEIDLDYFKNVLRTESRFLNFELLRTCFNIKDLKLTSILNSTAEVNLNIINKITDVSNYSNEDLIKLTKINTLMKMKEKLKHSEIKNIIADLHLIEYANYDIDIIKRYFKTNSTAHNSKYIKHYKSLIKSVKNIDSNNSIDARINEVKNYLKVA